MEKPNEFVYFVMQIATIALLIGGFAMIKNWQSVTIILIMLPYWWITHRSQRRIYSWIIFLIFVGLAVYGLLSKASPYFMVAGVSTGLACWELEDQIPKSLKSPITSVTNSCEKYHLKILSIAIAIGLFIAEASLFLKLSLPFGVIFLVAILVLFCIFQLFLLLKRN
jgi:hypothetical protein